MKKTFKEFYPLTKEEFKSLWNDCIFVFDANVLLNLYRYSQKTSQKLLEILKNEKIKNRVWMPYQFALEYQKNRLDVVVEIKNSYDKLLISMEGLIKTFSRHPFIKIKSLLQTPIRNIKKSQKKHPHWDEKDTILDNITEIFEGKIGPPFTDEKMKEIYKSGPERYSKNIPPGYRDARKEDNALGDLLGWLQIIDHSEKEKKPIILIIDDGKDDWWRITKNGCTVGPRYELIKELLEKTEKQFYMYDSNGFIKYSGEYLEENIDSSIVKEIQEITKKISSQDIAEVNTTELEESIEEESGEAESLEEEEIIDISKEDVGKSEKFN